MIGLSFLFREIPARYVALITIGSTLIIMLIVKQLVARKVVLVRPKKQTEKIKMPQMATYPD